MEEKNANPFRYLEGTVFPSTERTMAVLTDDTYGGAHRYYITNCLGFNDGKTEYTAGEGQTIQFIQKPADGGPIIPGVQSEQLVLMLLDRHARLNAAFPSAQYEKMKAGLEMFLEASRERVEERMSRNVMGELKK